GVPAWAKGGETRPTAEPTPTTEGMTMRHAIDRRTFLKAGTTTAAALLGGALRPSRSAAQSDKLGVAVGQWGLETPFAWRSSQSEKTLWESVYDSLITRDPKTFAIRPGLATEWKPSNEMR